MLERNLVSLIYVSKKVLGSDEDEHIVAVATARNRALDVTGALASTVSNYAQILEGSAFALTELMGSIERDDRHSEVRILREGSIHRRVFPNWTMAYAGPSSYMSNQVSNLISRESDTLTLRINQFVRILSGLAHT
ncbi:BLUF domain-containing protein [Sphingomonas sp. BAUL-RG-20F-R05-02]|uniref:BLUF domain-containing protein n=1 Tax=Sphingomonas sp. BAUL-RG-20F-R05-02 TaxID=2914830 RepID=UPI001F57D553|nr:BLUF domain-containing protein [Sphingomonas sp. BAUL-RG-20F-R05-02]